MKITKEKLPENLSGFDFVLLAVPKTVNSESKIKNGVLETAFFLNKERFEKIMLEMVAKKEKEEEEEEDGIGFYRENKIMRKYGGRLMRIMVLGIYEKYYEQQK